MPGMSYRRRLRSLLLYYGLFRGLINSLVCWSSLVCLHLFILLKLFCPRSSMERRTLIWQGPLVRCDSFAPSCHISTNKTRLGSNQTQTQPTCLRGRGYGSYWFLTPSQPYGKTFYIKPLSDIKRLNSYYIYI